MEGNLNHIDALTFFNDNLRDITMQEILALKNIVPIAKITPKQYEDWVRQSHGIVNKSFNLEGKGLDQDATEYLESYEELSLTLIKQVLLLQCKAPGVCKLLHLLLFLLLLLLCLHFIFSLQFPTLAEV